MGLGFVGAVMTAVVADAADQDGNPKKFVIGMQRPSTRRIGMQGEGTGKRARKKNKR